MNKNDMLSAFRALDDKLKMPTKLLLGGGGCMVLVDDFFQFAETLDIAIYKSSTTLQDIALPVTEVASELNLPNDWLNPYFETFLFSLPPDYEARLVTVFSGVQLIVNGLGVEDLLILKCFAGRDKDIAHARALLKRKPDIDLVAKHLGKLIDKKIAKAREAMDFLDDRLDEVA